MSLHEHDHPHEPHRLLEQCLRELLTIAVPEGERS